MVNPFFKNQGPIDLSFIISLLELKNLSKVTEQKVFDIKDLLSAGKNDITFFHSKKYKDVAKKNIPLIIKRCLTVSVILAIIKICFVILISRSKKIFFDKRETINVLYN